ncbi:MAG: hypothetical protein JNL98_21830 [Bryobacterales bacterium]|nr:hypothetical protein [Bryobacterales bacterium]
MWYHSLRSVGSVALIAAAAVVTFQVLIPPIVGLPDNGDFGRILRTFRLEPVVADEADRFFRYVTAAYRYSPNAQPVVEQLSSGHLVALPALLGAMLFSKDGTVDIRWMGFVHGGLFLVAWWLAIPLMERLRDGVRWLAVAAGVFVFCDLTYIQYFNSFFNDAESMLFLLLSMVLLLRLKAGAGETRGNLTGFLVCVGLLAASKSQHALLAIPLLAAGTVPLGRRFPRTCWTGGIAVALLAGQSFLTVPSSYRTAAFYNVVFYGILPVSSEPLAALSELGIEPSAIVFKGTHSYSENAGVRSPQFHQSLERKSSMGKLLWYFAQYPSVAMALIRKGVAPSAAQRLDGWGQFTKESGRAPHAPAHAFHLWGKVKQVVFAGRPDVWFGYSTICMMSLGVLTWNTRWLTVVLCLIAQSALALTIATLGDVLDYPRHLFVYHCLSDMILLGVIVAVAHRITAMRGSPERTPEPRKAPIVMRQPERV